MDTPYYVDGEDFFLGCGLTEVDDSDFKPIPAPRWGGWQGEVALKGIHAFWASEHATPHRAERSERAHRQWALRRAGKAKCTSKPCTVDGITVFPSVRALRAALGNGKNGGQSPNFRYVSRSLNEHATTEATPSQPR